MCKNASCAVLDGSGMITEDSGEKTDGGKWKEFHALENLAKKKEYKCVTKILVCEKKRKKKLLKMLKIIFSSSMLNKACQFF